MRGRWLLAAVIAALAGGGCSLLLDFGDPIVDGQPRPDAASVDGALDAVGTDGQSADASAVDGQKPDAIPADAGKRD